MLDGPVAQAVVVGEVGVGKQLEDPPLQEAKVQTKDNPVGEEKLYGQEVQACRVGKYVKEGQSQMLVLAKGGRG